MSIEVIAEGTGLRVVLLPSLGRDAHDFEDLASRLVARGYRALRPQPRGCGMSEGAMTGLTLFDLAADVTTAVEEVGGEGVVVVGHAFGSWVARATAAARPDLVHAVVLLAASRKGPIDPEIRTSISACFDATLTPEERITHLRRAFFAPGNDPSIWLDGWHPAVARMQREAGAAIPQERWWAAGGVPMLDVSAAQDAIAPLSRAHEIRDELGERVTVEIIQDAGHALLPEQPQRVADVLFRFLGKIGYEAAQVPHE